MIEIGRAIWRYRIVILSVFIFLFILDVVIGAIRLIAVELAIFVFGVVIGRMHGRGPSPMARGVAQGAPRRENGSQRRHRFIGTWKDRRS